MTNREVCRELVREMGGYNGETEDLDDAGRWLAADLAQETGLDMDAEADVASITTLRLACELPLIR